MRLKIGIIIFRIITLIFIGVFTGYGYRNLIHDGPILTTIALFTVAAMNIFSFVNFSRSPNERKREQ